MEKATYKVRYESCDGCSKTRTFKTKKGVMKFIEDWVGRGEISHSFNYMVSGDGIGKVVGLNFKLTDLYPEN